MKKITLFITLIAFTFGFSQEILKTDYPIYDGTFGDNGTATLTYNAQSFIFPTGAFEWGGFANNNTDAYPFQFDNGGQIVFTATTATDTQVKFLFEANPHPNNNPQFNVTVDLLAANGDMHEYTVDIPAYTTSGQTFNSAIFYVTERDVEVSVGQFKIKTYGSDGTSVVKTDYPIYDGTFGDNGTATLTYNAQSFIFPTGAFEWGGFANNNTDAYPFQFDNGGQIVFTATTATDTQVKFLFEANPHPNNNPQFNVTVDLLAANGDMHEYTVDIPAYTTSGQTFNSTIFYVTERDVEVSVGQFKIKTYAPPSGTDASLSSIQIDGSALSGFSSAITTYDYNLVYGTTTVPTISDATTTDAAASVLITQATSIPGSGTILVTAADGTTTSTYTVNFAAILPASNAPTPPTRDASDVISIYSDTYTLGVVGPDYNPFWNQSGTVDAAFDITGEGNNTVLYYTNFNFQGMVFGAPFPNASAMEYLHVDVWTATAGAVLKVTPINQATGGVTEVLVEVPLVNAGWSSVDLPKSSFTGMTWDSVFQLKFDGTFGTTPSDLFIDNIYFWKDASAGLDDNVFNTVKMFPNPAKDTVQFSVNSNENLDIEIFDMLGKSVLRVNDVQNEVNISDLNSGLYFVQMTLGTQQATKKLIVN